MPKKYCGRLHMRFRASTLLVALVASISVASPAVAQVPPPPETPAGTIQVWNANLHQLRDAGWRGFVERLAVNSFAPDILTLQDISRCDGNSDGARDFNQIMGQLSSTFGNHWAFAHSEPTDGSCGSRNAVVWNTNRFFQSITPVRWDPAGCAVSSDIAIAVALIDKDNPTGRSRVVVPASLHFQPGLGGGCLASALAEAHQKVSSLTGSRDITVMAGDVNQSPDLDSPTALADGLETDPDCWYRKQSAAHLDQTVLGSSCSSTAGSNVYYDAVWLAPESGGGTNPTATSFCQQYTFSTTPTLTSPDTEDAESSCTDLNLDDLPDKKRIDQIWLGWNPTGSAWTPPSGVAASYVQYASADTGLNLKSLNRYSDHRAVQALISYPPVTNPL